jgi:hypothetical protein
MHRNSCLVITTVRRRVSKRADNKVVIMGKEEGTKKRAKGKQAKKEEKKIYV